MHRWKSYQLHLKNSTTHNISSESDLSGTQLCAPQHPLSLDYGINEEKLSKTPFNREELEETPVEGEESLFQDGQPDVHLLSTCITID